MEKQVIVLRSCGETQELETICDPLCGVTSSKCFRINSQLYDKTLLESWAAAWEFSELETLRQIIGEGNGTPLQYSSLENPMDGRAW